MSDFSVTRMITRLLLLWILLLDSQAGFATIVDPGRSRYKEAALLTDLGPLLSASMDVRLGDITRSTETAWSRRPQLAPLESLPPPSAVDSIDADGFSALFLEAVALHEIGIETVLLAVDEPDRPARDLATSEVERAWQLAPQDKRVFVSFTRDDRKLAYAVKEQLQRLGFSVFLYVTREGETWADNVSIARYFQQAAMRLVLDTAAARKKGGVQTERAAALRLKEGSWIAGSSGNRIHDFKIAKGKSGAPCCQWCQRFAPAPNDCAGLFMDTHPPCGKIMCGVLCTHAGR